MKHLGIDFTMETVSNDNVNVTLNTHFDPPSQEDVRVLATSYMMYKIGESLLQPNSKKNHYNVKIRFKIL